jgi:OOP family OmpA-OmpF porin
MKRAKGKVAAGLIGIAALAASSAAFGQQEERGFYLGGAYGQAAVKGGCSDLRSDLATIGATVTACDDKDSGWKIFGGYRFNRHFAVEATYIDFGSLTATAVRAGATVNASGDATGFGVAAVGILPIHERFSVFGKAGILSTDLKATATGPGGTFSSTSGETELHYGLGAMFNITRNWGIRAEWERAEDSEVELISIGVQYRF